MSTQQIIKLFYYLFLAFIGIFCLLFIQFIFEKKQIKIRESVKHCVLENDVFIKVIHSRYDTNIFVTDKITEADYIIRNKKQIPIEDICKGKN